MLICLHPTGSTRNVRVKKLFWCSFLKKIFLVTNILVYSYSGEQSKLLVLSSASLFSCSCCFDFSYPQSSAQVSLNCAALGRQMNQWEANGLFKVYSVYSPIYSKSCYRYAKPVAIPKRRAWSATLSRSRRQKHLLEVMRQNSCLVKIATE